MRFLSLTFLFPFFLWIPARAASIELELSESLQTKSQDLSVDGTFNQNSKNETSSTEKNKYNWNFSYTHSASSVKQQSGESITDNSHDLSAGLGLETTSHFSVSGDLDYSKTPEENLQSIGPTLKIGYTYKFDDETDSSFVPSLGAELSAGYDNYTQTFTKEVRRKNQAVARPTTGSNTINKKIVEVALKASPVSWLSTKIRYTKYTFNKDVNEFLQYLDIHTVGRVSAGMEDALAGFSEHVAAFDLYFYFLADWEIDYTYSTSAIIVDGSTSTDHKVNLPAASPRGITGAI